MTRPLRVWALLLVAVALLTPASVEAHHIGTFVGEWRNEDPATRATTRYVIVVQGGELAISGYGACVPTECDWASAAGGPRTTPQADADDGRLTVSWPFGFKTQRDDLSVTPEGKLRADQFHDFTDDRPDRATTELFVRVSPERTYARVAVTARGRGTVTSEPEGIDCPELGCALEFESGTRLTLRAAPERGNMVASWGEACRGRAATCTVTVTRETAVSVQFAAIPRCVVPRLIGRTLTAAKRVLTASNCRLGALTRAYSMRVAAGRIIRQRPAARTRLANRARVAVVVSRGPR